MAGDILPCHKTNIHSMTPKHMNSFNVNALKQQLPESISDLINEVQDFLPASCDAVFTYRGHLVARSARWGDYSGMGLVGQPLTSIVREIDRWEGGDNE